jgi:signal transduction histidine kinase
MGALLEIVLLFVLALGPMVVKADALRSIRVVTDNDYPPFSFRDEKGKLQGIVVDKWRLWEAQTGIKVELQALEWEDALKRMKAGEFDVIDTIFKSREWARYWDFSQPYTRINVPIFFRKDISGITGLKSLQGFPVAAKDGDVIVNLLKQNGIGTVLLFTNYQAIVQAVKEHKVDVFVADQPSALYLLHRQGLHGEFMQSDPVIVGQLHRAVQKGNSGLLEAIDKGFAALRPEELRQIEEKWYGRTLGGHAALRYAGYAAVVGGIGLLGLMFWNLALNRQVNRRTADLRRLSARLLQVQDQERRHLARELHDTTAQHLAALSLNLARLSRALPPDSTTVQARCRECVELANQAAKEIRTHAYLLHPPLLEMMGLVGAVEDYAQGFSVRSGIQVELEAPADFGRLPEDTELALFRVIQESLANVLKHSGSKHTKIRLTRHSALVTLEVQDMGHGIPAEKLARLRVLSGGSGVGLGGMQERLGFIGGRLDIESNSSGTRVRATVPLASPELNPVQAT